MNLRIRFLYISPVDDPALVVGIYSNIIQDCFFIITHDSLITIIKTGHDSQIVSVSLNFLYFAGVTPCILLKLSIRQAAVSPHMVLISPTE